MRQADRGDLGVGGTPVETDTPLKAAPFRWASLVEKQLDRLRLPQFVIPDVEAVIARQQNNRVAFLILGDNDSVRWESVGLGTPRFGFLDHVIRRTCETATV